MDPIEFPKLRGLKLISQGKVRDVYEVDESTLLLVATDRVSAYDVILKTVISVVILPCKELTGRNRVIKPINDKGKILTQISVFWLGIVDHIPNHVITASVDEMPENVRPFKPLIEGRSMLVKKLKMFPFEFIVRGYLSGSAWREYKYSGTVWSKPLQPGLLESSKLEYCLYTPTTKEESGSGKHDAPVSEEECEKVLGRDIAGKIKQYCIGIYQDCAKYAEAKGVIIADTKFEFGIDNDGKICLADEILTPDSSRFWPIDDYCAGRPQSRLNCASFIFIHKCLISYGMTLSHNSYDKQYIRDYLVKMNFDKKTPTYLSDKIAKETRNKYITLYEKITSKRWSK